MREGDAGDRVSEFDLDTSGGAQDSLPLATLSYAPVRDQASLRAVLTIVAMIPIGSIIYDGGALIGYFVTLFGTNAFVSTGAIDGLLRFFVALRLAVSIVLLFSAFRARSSGRTTAVTTCCLVLIIFDLVYAGLYGINIWPRYFGKNGFAVRSPAYVVSYVQAVAALVCSAILPAASFIAIKSLNRRESEIVST